MVMDTQAYAGYPVPCSKGPAEPQLDGPSEGEMDAPANVIVTVDGEAVKGVEAAGINWAAPAGKQAYVDRIAPATLTANADTLIHQLADTHAEIQALRDKVRNAQEFLDDRETTLTLSEGYLAGKNAEIRKAWLLRTLTEDSFYAIELVEQRALKVRLDRAEARFESLARRWDLAKLDIRLAIASLNFMAGGE